MSRYIGYTGRAIIKEEYREDFCELYCRRYDKMKTDLMRAYVERCGGTLLDIKSWNDGWYNDCWDGLLPTAYDPETGEFSYGVTLNFHNTDLFLRTDLFIYVLTLISDEEIPYKF